MEDEYVDTIINDLSNFSERYFDRIHRQGAPSMVSIKRTKEFGSVYLFRKVVVGMIIQVLI